MKKALIVFDEPFREIAKHIALCANTATYLRNIRWGFDHTMYDMSYYLHAVPINIIDINSKNDVDFASTSLHYAPCKTYREFLLDNPYSSRLIYLNNYAGGVIDKLNDL